MAEALVMVVNRRNLTDATKDTKLFKRGDIVDVFPDGWIWGSGELTNPIFRIIKLPNISLKAMQAFLSSEPETDPLNPKTTRWLRFYKLDVDLADLPPAFVNYLKDNTRAQPFFTANWTWSQINQFRVQKASISG